MKRKKKKTIEKLPDRSVRNIISSKMIAVILVAVCLIVWISMVIMPEERLDLEFADGHNIWQAVGDTRFAVTGSAVEFTKGEGEFLVALPQVNLSADNYDVCRIEGSWPISYDQGRIFFISPFNQQFNFNFRFDYDTGTAGRMRARYIDLKGHGAWQGIIKALMLMPAINAERVVLKRISFIRANPWTRFKAAWGAFTRYQDPLLGTCLAMATPILMGRPYNPTIVPILWILLAASGLIITVAGILKADQVITKTTLAIYLIVLIIVWGLLDLRNNVYYYKGILRNTSLYWGKSIQEKRGIAVGDREFTDFMRFCDENIPLIARVINQVPDELPGTPTSYLSKVQFGAMLKPRFPEGSARSYYIYYKPANRDTYEVMVERKHISHYYDLGPGEQLLQEISLPHALESLYQIDFWAKAREDKEQKIELTVLDQDMGARLGRSEYLSRNGDALSYRYLPKARLGKNNKVFLRIRNTDNASTGIGVNEDLNKEDLGTLVLNGKNSEADLSLRLIYRPKDLALFKRFNERAYILVEEELE